MPAAPFIPLIIQGASAAVGAIAKHKAADKAVQQQTQAGDKALALQQQMYNRGQQILNPWVSQGQSAVSALGSAMGLPQFQTAQGMPGALPPGVAVPRFGPQPYQGAQQAAQQAASVVGGVVNRDPRVRPLGATMQQLAARYGGRF